MKNSERIYSDFLHYMETEVSGAEIDEFIRAKLNKEFSGDLSHGLMKRKLELEVFEMVLVAVKTGNAAALESLARYIKHPKPKKLTPRQKDILRFIQSSDPPPTQGQIARKFFNCADPDRYKTAHKRVGEILKSLGLKIQDIAQVVDPETVRKIDCETGGLGGTIPEGKPGRLKNIT